MLDLARHPAVEQRGIEGLDRRDPVAARHQRLPGFVGGFTDCGQETNTGDDNSAGNNRSPLTRPAAQARRQHTPDWMLPHFREWQFFGQGGPEAGYFFLASM
jgi:hypothetical protein